MDHANNTLQQFNFGELLRLPLTDKRIIDMLAFFNVTKKIRVKSNENSVSIDAPTSDIGFGFSTIERMHEFQANSYPEGTLFLSTIFIHVENTKQRRFDWPFHLEERDDRQSVYQKMNFKLNRTNAFANSATWEVADYEVQIDFSKDNKKMKLIRVMRPYRP